MIAKPEEASAGWLTCVLRRAGVLREGEVKNVRVVLERELFVSRVARLEIEYSSGSTASAPQKLFLKLSKQGAESPNVLANNGTEVEFYSVIGRAMKEGPLIRCYDAVFCSETNASHILLADLSDTHFQPSLRQIPSSSQSYFAVKALAKFHADWHDHPKVGAEIGRVFDESWLSSFVGNLRNSVTRFLDFLGEGISAERRKAYEIMLASSRQNWGRITNKKGLTVTHGDMHWWNFLYPHNPQSSDVRLFDWQLWHIDLGARDLAFLIALGGFGERRPEIEGGLLSHYHATLLENGVSDYPWAEFWYDYRISVVRNLNIPVIFWAQGRDRQLWSSMLERAFAAYDDLRCADLLSE